ncbi:C6 zinc finger transcription factor [Colletotrichum plurivorum]|uniref:C6 zinc finger transcription factor n=1 Tax=Colletotrichum plurivorum TaxID=2175906 RepID=A0A8H6KN72_9PEZI|nr:C6 zinc finger transcription factor [Colletotrichum plurivorum]
MTCPGYRDLSDFYFRDETANAAFKVQNRKVRRRLPARARTQPQSSADAQSSKQAQVQARVQTPTLQEQTQTPTQTQQAAEAVASSAASTSVIPAPARVTGTLVAVPAPAASRGTGTCLSVRAADPPTRTGADAEADAAAVVRYRNVSQPLEDLARTYFMVDYIATSPFEYLPRLCPHGLNGNDALSAAILAASFASLSLKLFDNQMMKQARCYYARALCRTNQALGSAELAVQDGTLAAVLLLGLFEAIVFTGKQSLDSWNAHTIGAVELLRLRGPQQLRTPLGRQLFIHSSGNIRTSCAHTKNPVPPRLLSLYEDVRPQLDLHDPVSKLVPVVDQLASLRSRAERADDQHRRDLILEALTLDADTARMGQAVPEEWKFAARLPGERAPMTYKGISLRYPSLQALRYWNAVRIIRMFLNDLVSAHSALILHQGPDLDDETDYDELQRSTARTMSTLVIEVLASCGEYLEPAEERFSVAARCLIWPLTVIAEAFLTPPDARRFAVDCLDRLGRDCRIPQDADVTTWRRGVQETGWYVSPPSY